MAGKRSREVKVGERSGRLVVVQDQFRVGYNARVVCECDCGTVTEVGASEIRNRRQVSCGCYKPNKLEAGEACLNRVIAQYQSNAKVRGIVFVLTREQMVALVGQNCHYCGESPSNGTVWKQANEQIKYSGVDRVDNARGYVEGNVVPCCYYCNRAKADQTYTEFIQRAQRIALNHVRLTAPPTADHDFAVEPEHAPTVRLQR